MALTIGTDTYISLSDANNYLSGRYLSTDPKLIAWNAMTDSDNEVLLRQAQQLIDRQPIQGFKVATNQTLQFPRVLYSSYQTGTIRKVTPVYGPVSPTTLNSHWYTQPGIPLSVAQAQCEIALSLVTGESKRVQMQREGVKSFSVGGLSETYSGSINNVVSPVAKDLLAPFLAGGFPIC